MYLSSYGILYDLQIKDNTDVREFYVILTVKALTADRLHSRNSGKQLSESALD